MFVSNVLEKGLTGYEIIFLLIKKESITVQITPFAKNTVKSISKFFLFKINGVEATEARNSALSSSFSKLISSSMGISLIDIVLSNAYIYEGACFLLSLIFPIRALLMVRSASPDKHKETLSSGLRVYVLYESHLNITWSSDHRFYDSVCSSVIFHLS
jgi:hypothetical protein